MNKRLKQILAIIAIVIIAALYIVALVLAIFQNENTQRWFIVAIVATIVVPLLMYIYTWLYKLVNKQMKNNNVQIVDDEKDEENK